jgi:hypothetical protein
MSTGDCFILERFFSVDSNVFHVILLGIEIVQFLVSFCMFPFNQLFQVESYNLSKHHYFFKGMTVYFLKITPHQS